MKESFNHYTKEEALDEAQKMKEKVESGEAENYQEAEKQIEKGDNKYEQREIKDLDELWEEYRASKQNENNKEKLEEVLEIARKEAAAIQSVKAIQKKIKDFGGPLYGVSGKGFGKDPWYTETKYRIRRLFKDREVEVADAEVEAKVAACETADEARELYYSAPLIVNGTTMAKKIYMEKWVELSEEEVKKEPEPQTAAEAYKLLDSLADESKLSDLYSEKLREKLKEEAAACKTSDEVRAKKMEIYGSVSGGSGILEDRLRELLYIEIENKAATCKTANEVMELYDKCAHPSKTASTCMERGIELAEKEASACETVEQAEKLFFGYLRKDDIKEIFRKRLGELSSK